MEEELSLKTAALHHFGRCLPVNYVCEILEAADVFAALFHVQTLLFPHGNRVKRTQPPTEEQIAHTASQKTHRTDLLWLPRPQRSIQWEDERRRCRCTPSTRSCRPRQPSPAANRREKLTLPCESSQHRWETAGQRLHLQSVAPWSSEWRGTCRDLCSESRPSSPPAPTSGHLCRGRTSPCRCSPWLKCRGRSAGDGDDRRELKQQRDDTQSQTTRMEHIRKTK